MCIYVWLDDIFLFVIHVSMYHNCSRGFTRYLRLICIIIIIIIIIILIIIIIIIIMIIFYTHTDKRM